MGRWKDNGSGGSVYDPNDSGPDQVAPDGQGELKQGESGNEANDYVGQNTTVDMNQAPSPAPAPVKGQLPPVQNGGYQLFGGGGQPQTNGSDALIQQLMQRNQAGAEDQGRFENSIREQVMRMMDQNQPVTNADQINALPESAAFNRVTERSADAARMRSAEQRAAQGVGQNQHGEVGGALGGDIENQNIGMAEQMQAHQSQMVLQDLQQRRQSLQQALQIGAGIMNADQQRELQRQLAALDASIKTELGRADIGLRGQLGGGQLSLGLLQALLGNQFNYDQLGLNAGQIEAMLNQQSAGSFF